MSVLVNKNSRVLVQGITGKAGSFHAEQCLAYGTKIVAGVKPGGKGTRHLDVPIYNTVRDAREDTGADVALIFVPAPVCADAIFEAAEAAIPLIVTITEGVPVLDMARVRAAVRGSGLTMIGPNCPGIITPGEAKIGIMPGSIHKSGRVGVISRSGTLTYEAVWQLSERGIGQSTCIGIGGDPIGGLTFKEALALFEADPLTDGVVMIGEIGGTAEEEAAAFIKERMKKPVVCFIAGTTAPKGKRMGHAGAIIAGGKGTAAEKIAALEEAGATVVASAADIGEAMQKRLDGKASKSGKER